MKGKVSSIVYAELSAQCPVTFFTLYLDLDTAFSSLEHTIAHTCEVLHVSTVCLDMFGFLVHWANS